MKWYHASPTRYRAGDLVAGKSTGYLGQFDRPMVFLTNSPIPHHTIFFDAYGANWTVYRVRPLRKLHIGKVYSEGACELVEVVQRVGHARGLCNSDLRHEFGKGSFVYWKGKRE